MEKRFDPELPIVLGLGGISGTGKTTTANGISPPSKVAQTWHEEPTVTWDHLYFALPLYRMVTARQSIEGGQSYDRMAYEIHETLVESLGNSPLYGAPSYDDLVQMVYEIMETPCPREGKPREFLQQVGTELVRGYDKDAWVKWMDRKIKKDFQSFLADQQAAENRREIMETPPPGCECGIVTDEGSFQPYYGVVISDCRFENEVKFVHDYPNGIAIKLTASPEVIEERQRKRDGYAMEDAHKTHSSETSLTTIPDEWYDEIINTDNMTIQDQVEYIKQIVTNFTGAQNA